MGIKFNCPHCGKGLNVKANLAGRRGLCPHCKGRVEIPVGDGHDSIPVAPIAEVAAATNILSEPQGRRASNSGGGAANAGRLPTVATGRSTTNPTSTAFEDLDPNSFLLDRPQVELAPSPKPYFDWIADAPEAVWYVRNRAGGQYGPAVGSVMRTWLQEGRVSRDCYVWREGWAHWRQANDVFPHWFEPRTNGVQPTLPNQIPAAQPIQRSGPHPMSSNPSAPSATSRGGTPGVFAETHAPLEHKNRRHNSTFLFLAILIFVLVLSGVAITAVVFMIKKANEVQVPSNNGAPVEIRDPFL
ncbi:MAG: DUF4339 domain-containing protein [Planctomycetaceae bacterium]|nr:DUF4339 domain-containing protein [Planctomycetaceae bacterium]